MPFDLVIRNGTIVDGSGIPPYRADVGVNQGRIAWIGRIASKGHEELDAEGHVVTPGFIDTHTHMDAQIMWDPLGTCSSWHGVTTVVMGNCGFTLAPSHKDRRDLVVRNLERAEDISPIAMAQGITWSWERFSEYLDTVDCLPKGINFAANIGHSALRTWAMGDRAFESKATDTDINLMREELEHALLAGAIGFTTSRTNQHETSDDRPVASRMASWGELSQLVDVLSSLGTGILEIAPGPGGLGDPEDPIQVYQQLGDLAVSSGIPVTFGLPAVKPGSFDTLPGCYETLEIIDNASRAGGRIIGQTHCRGVSSLLSFKTRLPFDSLPEWREVRDRPLDRQITMMKDPAVRDRLVQSATTGNFGRAIGGEARKPNYEIMKILDKAVPPNPTVAEVARSKGIHPVALMIDLAVATKFDQFFLQPILLQEPEDAVAVMKHPSTVMTFSDSGAHVSQIMDSSIQTFLLSYWVRDQHAFTLAEAIRMLTFVPATMWGFSDRGLVREGFVADLNIFDPYKVAPELPTVTYDLPGGAVRLQQRATGFLATVVNGIVLLSRGEHTGALPGKLLRGPLSRTQ